MTRTANFFISKNLRKTDKMPNHRQWKVSENDRCVEGPILLYLRSKGLFIDRVCKPLARHCVLTKRGFLLIYMSDEKGFVLDMHRAFEIKTLCDNVTTKNGKYRRCRVKIRYTFGTVNLILTNAKIEKWRDHLLNATNSPALSTPLALPRRGPDYVIVSAPLPHPRPIDDEGYGSCDALRSIFDQSKTTGNWTRVTIHDSESSDPPMFTAVDVTDDDEYQCLPSSLMEDEDTCMSSTTTLSEVEVNTVIEAPHKPLVVLTTLCKVPVSRKQVKFSDQSAPVKASDSSNDENAGFNSFQFWRQSIFESDV